MPWRNRLKPLAGIETRWPQLLSMFWRRNRLKPLAGIETAQQALETAQAELEAQST